MNRSAGVTLIEILIAVSLLSVISGGILIAMRLGLSTMSRTNAKLEQNRRVVNARKILENEISGFVNSLAEVSTEDGSLRRTHFLQAEPQTMRFVSMYSLQDAWRGAPQIVVLQVIPGERNSGVRLIIDEIPWKGPAQAGSLVAYTGTDETGNAVTRFSPVIPSPRSFVLADRLRYCRFSYQQTVPGLLTRVWEPQWRPGRPLPMGIRIEMAPLDASGADLHVTTVTVPFSVTTTLGTTYTDAFP